MKKGGARPGAGRPKGRLSQATLERKMVQDALQQRILHHADEILNAQLHLGKGLTYVFRIDKKVGPKGGVIEEHVLVEDPMEIKAMLDELQGSNGEVDGVYYYITTKDPNNQAIDSMFNRAIGKPVDNIDLTSQGEKISISDEQFQQIIGAAAKRTGRNQSS